MHKCACGPNLKQAGTGGKGWLWPQIHATSEIRFASTQNGKRPR